jgi:hypothetical protein
MGHHPADRDRRPAQGVTAVMRRPAASAICPPGRLRTRFLSQPSPRASQPNPQTRYHKE